jgi:hypothetical protein
VVSPTARRVCLVAAERPFRRRRGAGAEVSGRARRRLFCCRNTGTASCAVFAEPRREPLVHARDGVFCDWQGLRPGPVFVHYRPTSCTANI